MFTTSYSNIFIESCIPIDTFNDGKSTVFDEKNILNYINSYFYHKTSNKKSKLPIGYIILYLLSQKFTKVFGPQIHCGWSNINEINKIYDIFSKFK